MNYPYEVPTTFCGLHHMGEPKLFVFEWFWCYWGEVLGGGKVDLLKRHWCCKMFGVPGSGCVERHVCCKLAGVPEHGFA